MRRGCRLHFVGPCPRGDGGGLLGFSRRGRRSYKGGMPGILWEPRPRGDGGGLLGFSRRGRRSYKSMDSLVRQATDGTTRGSYAETADPARALWIQAGVERSSNPSRSSIMKKIPLPSCGLRTAAAVALVLGLSACAGMTEQEKRTAIGAGVGAVGGSILTGGSAAGTLGGAAVGGWLATKSTRTKTRPTPCLKPLRSFCSCCGW